MKGAVLLPRNRPVTVARGPVPRERSIDRCMARDRPSPYGEGGRFSAKKPSGYRSAGACPPREPRRRDLPVSIPRERPMASRRRVSPPHPCRSGLSEALVCLPSDLDLFGIGRSRTTELRNTLTLPYRGGLSPANVLMDRSMARDRPSPYGESGGVLPAPQRGGLS